MNKRERQVDTNFIRKALIISLLALFVVYFSQILNILKGIFTIAFPIILGLVIAYVVNLILKSLEKRFFPNSKSKIINELRRPLCLILSFVIIIAAIYLILSLIIPQINDSILIITEGIPKLAEDIRLWFLDVTEGLDWASEYRDKISNTQLNWSDLVSRAASILKASLDGILGSTFTIINGILAFFITGFTAIIFTASFLSSKEMIGSQFSRLIQAYLSKKSLVRIKYVLAVLDDKYSNFIKGKLIDSLTVGLMTLIIMLVFRFPYAPTISVVTMVTSIIPIVGSYLGGLVGFLMIAVVDIHQAFLFVIVFAISLQLESSIIYPRIAGKSIGLPGIWVFSSVLLGGALAGPLGMIFLVPLAASIYTFIKHDVEKKEALDRAEPHKK
ncbi:MAG: AI-2E family transporter [Tissierellia bacterium]|nr:AI-2E family transporter [Tissierellia bacterium]